jgi:hypothetical protein
MNSVEKCSFEKVSLGLAGSPFRDLLYIKKIFGLVNRRKIFMLTLAYYSFIKKRFGLVNIREIFMLTHAYCSFLLFIL